MCIRDSSITSVCNLCSGAHFCRRYDRRLCLLYTSLQELTFSAFKGQKIISTKYEQNYILSSVNRPTKSSVIFGNNAVGKTNILYALLGLQQIISTGMPIKKDVYKRQI